MSWAWIMVAAWLLIGVGLALLIGRSIVFADRDLASPAEEAPNFVVDPVGPGGHQLGDSRTTDLHPGASAGERADRQPEAPREPPTIPGLRSARPPVGRPPVPIPRVTRRPPQSGSGSA